MRRLLAVLLVAAPAQAYVRTVNNSGLCIWWGPRGHSFVIDAQGTPDVPGPSAFVAIRNSFATWGGVGCSNLSFADEGISPNPADRLVGYFPGAANRNLVLFRTANCQSAAPPGDACRNVPGNCANKYDCWDKGENVIAITITTTNTFTGEILDSDIEINDAPRADGSRNLRFTTADGPPCVAPSQAGCVDIDVQNTVTHEAGHTLGLAHTPVTAATMYASAPSGETSKRTLHQDDIDAICAIYPRGAATVTCLEDPSALTRGPSGCGCAQSQTGAGGFLALVLLLSRAGSRRLRRTPPARHGAARPEGASLSARGARPTRPG